MYVIDFIATAKNSLLITLLHGFRVVYMYRCILRLQITLRYSKITTDITEN